MSAEPAVLFIEDLQNQKLLRFEGTHFGYVYSASEILNSFDKKMSQDLSFGEVVFNTAMTGYQEILTDPSYFGQMICMTYPHIGNTGINFEDNESEAPWCAGLIVHDYCGTPSNWRSKKSLGKFLIEHKIPAIQDVDTRSLTILLRSRGSVRGLILNRKEGKLASELFSKMPRFEGRDLIQQVSCTDKKIYLPKTKKANYRIVVIDFGIKTNLLRILNSYDFEIIRVPAKTSGQEILNLNPDGVFLSNGPGDPSAVPYAVQTVSSLLGKIPVFGVCMGHQILSLAMGAQTFKLKFGHHGANQPVLEKETGRVYITSQNHGFAVDLTSLPNHIMVTHTHLNDKTIAGICSPDQKAYSVQFHPEASPGPHDSMLVFNQFIRWVTESKLNV